MAVTENTYTQSGSTTNYSFTFPYLQQSDVKVTVAGTASTAWTFHNATTVKFNTAPANGAAIRIYRDTADTNLSATFYAGSAIKSQDLNDNFTQNLYVTQESANEATTATTTAETATTTANSATTTANGAVTTANSAVATANAATTTAGNAVTTANSAVTTANAATATANTASTNASNAVTTANTANTTAGNAVTTANGAVTTANGAVTTANTASTNATTAINTANSAVTTANTASTNATNAVTTANAATTTANGAVTTANTASTNASTAVTTANSASATASAAQAAVANSVLYTPVADVANIPGSPSNNDYVEVANSTGIESFSPMASLPSGFTGDAGLTVRIRYTSAGSTWNYQSYHANDSEDRYIGVYGKHNTTQVIYTVKVATKTAAHRYNSSGHSSGYTIGGIESPFLTLIPGNTYRFDQSDSSNSGHPLAFYKNADKTGAWTTNVTTNGTPGSSGAYTQIEIADTTPTRLSYQCTSHAFMGNGMTTNTGAGGAGATGGGNDQIFSENDQVMTTSYSISANKNASCVGPISLNSGAVLTIPSTSKLLVLN